MDKIEKYLDHLILKGNLSRDDPKFDFFKKFVVPAILNEWILPNGSCSNSFKCPFYVCTIITADSDHMKKHMQQEHYGEIPEGVFGLKKNFECFQCEKSFSNFTDYKIHRLLERNEKLKKSKEPLQLRREDFINKEIGYLIQSGSLNPNDEKIDVFKKYILPNVHFFSPKGFFRCPFEMCGYCNSRKEILQEHLRDEHYDQIPLGIFGTKTSFKCLECQKNFDNFKIYKEHKYRCFCLKYFYEKYQNELVEEKLDEYKKQGLLKETDPNYKFFVREVLPSLVTPKKLKSGLVSDFYECPFKKCGSGTSKQEKLKKHLIDQHSDLIPSNVFGQQDKINQAKIQKKIGEKNELEAKQASRPKRNMNISSAIRKVDHKSASEDESQSKAEKKEHQANTSMSFQRKRTSEEILVLKVLPKRQEKVFYMHKNFQKEVHVEKKKLNQPEYGTSTIASKIKRKLDDILVLDDKKENEVKSKQSKKDI